VSDFVRYALSKGTIFFSIEIAPVFSNKMHHFLCKNQQITARGVNGRLKFPLVTDNVQTLGDNFAPQLPLDRLGASASTRHARTIQVGASQMAPLNRTASSWLISG